MEKNMENAKMGQLKNYEQVHYSSAEARNQGLGSVNQWAFQDPYNSIKTYIRPPDLNLPVGARPDLNLPVVARPVLNYSIQTGEEFALEFMRERVNPMQHIVPNSSNEPNNAPVYMDVKGTLGIFHTVSDSGLDTSTIPSVEKRRIQNPESNASSLNGEKVYGQPFQPVNQTSSESKSSHGFQSHTSSRASGSSSTIVKILCSFGGKILPRPKDGKLRYVGGESRIVRISRDISWEELVQKTWIIYNQPHTIKYQLPDEDLDALVSVSCEEDLHNMMEEFYVLEDGGFQKLRIFLISNDDLNDSQLGLENVESDSELQYVVAVNGMDFGSRRSSIAMENTSGINLEELLSLSVEQETGQIAVGLAVAGSVHREVGIPNQSSQMMLPTSSPAFESNPRGYPVQTMNHGQSELHTFHQIDCFPDVGYKNNIPPAVLVQHNYGSHPSNHVPVAENLIPHSIYGHMTSKGAMAVGQPHGSLKAKVPEVSISKTTVKNETTIPKKVEFFKEHSLEKELLLKDAKMTEENTIQKISESNRMQTVKNEKIISSHQYESSSLNAITREDASIISAAEDTGTRVVQTTGSEKSQDSMSSSVPLDTVKEGNMQKIDVENQFYKSGKAFMPVHGDSGDYSNDFNHDAEVLPQSLFRSERIPREQAGLNRLSKSDDHSGSQFLMTHARSDVSQQMTESIDKLTDWNVDSQNEEFLASAKSVLTNEPAIEEKSEFKKSITVTDYIGAKNSSVHDENLKSNLYKPDRNAVVLPDRDSSASNFPMTGRSSENPQDESASNLTKLHWGKISGKTFEEPIQPPTEEANPAVTSCQGKPSVGDSNSEQANILIDINDRFPRDFLPDIFSEARVVDSSAGFSPLRRDGNGLSLNVEHEPKHWSFFQKLAKNDFARKDKSLMDQDHLSLSSTHANIGEVESIENSYRLSRASGNAMDHIDSCSNFEDDTQQQPSSIIRPDTMKLPSDYDPPQTSGVPILQFDGQMDSRIPESEYQDEKEEAPRTKLPLVDISLRDFDLHMLQIIKNKDLEELRELGSGTYGTVYHGKWKGSDVAIKRIKKSCFTGRSSEQERLAVEFWREAEILSKLHHPNVVAFYGVVQDGPGGTLATVAEYMVNGSLRHVLICKDRHLDRRKRLIIAMDAAFGMEYLHSRNIVHFDLKCDNLLVNLKDPSRPICKVGDFGLSKIKRNTLVTSGVRGTLPWMAPELLNGGSSKVSEKVDVFSFGIVLWEILTGEEPYANMHYGAIIGGIVNNTLRPPVPSFCDPEWRLLMEQCWAPDPMLRPSFTEIARRLRKMSAASITRPQGLATQTQLSK
ncbi:serine threonine- kinase pakA-like [Olea europaea subsp. europaea]|uniref:Serine threonine- kinase pakA-like n=1 Tax=Olea europaea subsp. europaea TaxID=158383 RepID=A0A8S0SQL1_OLEEU|nr:serine threonine- kinase pakA-like [Olea europaea subsp. europaea]